MAIHKKSYETLIRKIKKKLRQIENLERLNRPLFDEEIVKVKSKVSLRQELKQTLQDLDELEEEEPSEDDGYGEDGGLSTSSLQQEHIEEDSRCESIDNDRLQISSGGDSYSSNGERVDEDVSQTYNEEVDNKEAQADTSLVRQSAGEPAVAHSGGNRETKKETSAVEKKVKSVKEKSRKETPLSKKLCRVTSLEGHNDLVTSLVAVGDTLISASRDTTLRSWDILTGAEKHIFGGHTEYVTCVAVLDKKWNDKFDPAVGEDDQIVVSGSFDCSLKLWSLNTGRPIKSVYTFNPITCICVSQEKGLLFSGSDGGKLEVWELWSGTNCWSEIVYDGSVTGLKVCGDTVFSGSSTGVLKVHKLSTQPAVTLSSVFESENLRSDSGRSLCLRHIRCLEVSSTALMYGDDARNIKIVDWKKGFVHKVSNHDNSFSSIDALCCSGDHLVSSSYDLSTGLAYINVRSSETMEYLGSIDDNNTDRLVCLESQTSGREGLIVFSGGMELKMWEVAENNGKWRSPSMDSVVVPVQYRSHLTQRAVDSESDVSDSEEEEEEESGEDIYRQHEETTQGGAEGESAGSWCNIL